MTSISCEETPLLGSIRSNENVERQPNGGDPTKELSTWGLFLALLFTWVGSMLAALDTTITSTVSATIASEFNSLTVISWLGTAYLIAVAASQPLTGKLSDIFDRRSVLMVCSLIFALGNAICGLAISKDALIMGRVAAGIGAGGLNAISSFVATDLVPTRQRGLWYGFGMLVFGAGLGLGGLVGGGINDIFGWRWAFIALIPLTTISALGVHIFVPTHTERKRTVTTVDAIKRIDFLGALLLVSAVALFLWVLNLEEGRNPSSILRSIALPSSGVLISAFVLTETLYAPEPILPLHLLRNRTVAAASLTSFFNAMAFFSLMFYVPLYFQVQGSTPTDAGLRIVPESIGVAFGSMIAGYIMRLTGYCGKLKIAVLVVFLGGLFGFFGSDLETPTILPEIYLFLNGMGYAGMLNTMLTALICAVDRESQAVATSLVLLFRGTGSTIGVAVSGRFFRKTLERELARIEDPLNAAMNQSRVFHDDLHKCVIGAHDCPQAILDAYMSALHATFQLTLGFGLVGLILGSLAKNYKLNSKHAKTGIEEDNK